MDIELKNKWLQALRSGEYAQTTGCLKDKTGFCCLGVLCDITDNTAWNLNKYGEYDYSFTNETNSAYSLPDRVADQHQLRTNVEYQYEGEHQTYHRPLIDIVIDMNDDSSNFSEIADYLEKHLPTSTSPSLPAEPTYKVEL